jgi:glycosyltransferase 2 family protein
VSEADRSLTADSLLRKIRGGRKGWIRLAIIAAVTAGIFYLLFRRIDYGKVGHTLEHADPLLLLAAGLLTATFPLLSAYRWKRMLLALGYAVSLRDCFSMIMAAWPMSTITPSKSGDLMKAYYLKDRIPPSLVVGSVLAERTLDVLVLLVLALTGCLAFGRWALAGLSGLGLAGGLLAIFLLLRLRLPVPAKFQSKVEPMLRSLRLLGRSPALLGLVLLYTVLNWLASIAQVAICYRALGTHVPFGFVAGALPLAVFVGLLPLTLSGMGTRDSAIIVLFAHYAASDVSLGVGILYSLFGYWLPAVVGLPFLRHVLPKHPGGRNSE